METTRELITDESRFITISTNIAHRLTVMPMGKLTYVAPGCRVNGSPSGYVDDTGVTTCEICLSTNSTQTPYISE